MNEKTFILEMLTLFLYFLSLSYSMTVTQTPQAKLVKDILSEVLQLSSSHKSAFLSRIPYSSALKKNIAAVELLGEPPCFPDLWQRLDGEWRLLYSNNVGTDTPNSGLFSIEKVTQRIQKSKDYSGLTPDGPCYAVENILSYKTPILSGTISLCHSSEVLSQTRPASTAIDLEAVNISGFQDIKVDLIRILGPSFLRRGSFATTYIDDTIRISRGQFGELRVFQRL